MDNGAEWQKKLKTQQINAPMVRSDERLIHAGLPEVVDPSAHSAATRQSRLGCRAVNISGNPAPPLSLSLSSVSISFIF